MTHAARKFRFDVSRTTHILISAEEAVTALRYGINAAYLTAAAARGLSLSTIIAADVADIDAHGGPGVA